jgi:hypothetical protein
MLPTRVVDRAIVRTFGLSPSSHRYVTTERTLRISARPLIFVFAQAREHRQIFERGGIAQRLVARGDLAQ